MDLLDITHKATVIHSVFIQKLKTHQGCPLLLRTLKLHKLSFYFTFPCLSIISYHHKHKHNEAKQPSLQDTDAFIQLAHMPFIPLPRRFTQPDLNPKLVLYGKSVKSRSWHASQNLHHFRTLEDLLKPKSLLVHRGLIDPESAKPS
jgi:hypothetical protein